MNKTEEAGRVINFAPPEDQAITFHAPDGRELLRVAPDGFHVEGRPVQIDDLEEHDRTVYKTLKALLAGGWS